MVTNEDKSGMFGREETLPHSAIQAQFGFLQGKVLTVVEAALDGSKLDAVKSLIKKMFSEQQTWVRELCYPECRMMTTDEAYAKVDGLGEVHQIKDDVIRTVVRD
jgi:hypothetical protein